MDFECADVVKLNLNPPQTALHSQAAAWGQACMCNCCLGSYVCTPADNSLQQTTKVYVASLKN